MSRSVGVEEGLRLLGYENPIDAIKNGLKEMPISKLAVHFGFAVSTLSRYCDNKGIRPTRKHPKKLASQGDIDESVKQLKGKPSVRAFFKCRCCDESKAEELRGKIIPAFCRRCERHHRQSRT